MAQRQTGDDFANTYMLIESLYQIKIYWNMIGCIIQSISFLSQDTSKGH